MTKPIMTNQDPRWDEFTDRLSGPEGVDFRDDVTWDCDNTQARPKAVKILESMGYDIKQSLAWFTSKGGHCDCEILFNCTNEDD